MHAHDHGLTHDLHTLDTLLKERRRALGWLAGLSAVGLLGCGGGGDDAGSSSSSSSGGSTTGTGTTTTTTSSCSVIPEETTGPNPGDGSNGVSALALSGIVRSDIRSSFAGASGVADGVLLTVKLQLVNTNGSCADLSGYAIYLWHCDRQGRYSMYSSGVTAENFLRGVQATDSDGIATFTSIFPGCYAGRMPHIHFEVYRTTTTATSYTNKLKTSQLAFPESVCDTVYATSGYSASVANFNAISFSTDNVFSDGETLQMATVTGDVTNGYTATLTVGVGV